MKPIVLVHLAGKEDALFCQTHHEMRCETRENKIKPNVLALVTEGNELSHQPSLKSFLQLSSLPKHTFPFHTYSLNLILIKKKNLLCPNAL